MRLYFAAFLLTFAALQAEASPQKIRLAVIQSLTGMAQEDGTNVVRAVEQAAKRLKSEKGVEIELLVEDDASDPKQAVSAYQKLWLAAPDAFIGPTWSFTTRAIVPLAARDKQLLFSVSNAPEMLDLEEGRGYLFTNAFSLRSDIAPFKEFLALGKPVKKIAFIANDTPWAQAQLSLYRPLLHDLGIEIVDEVIARVIEAANWSETIPRLKARKPDAVMILLGRNDVELILRRAREIDFAPRFYGATHSFDALRQNPGNELFEGFCLTYPYEQLRRDRRFYEEFVRAYGEEPRLYADTAYDGVFVLAEAVERSRSENIPLTEAVKRTSFRSPSGHYVYSPQFSLSAGRSSLVCVEQGRLVVR